MFAYQVSTSINKDSLVCRKCRKLPFLVHVLNYLSNIVAKQLTIVVS
jgi:hypothetical protein